MRSVLPLCESVYWPDARAVDISNILPAEVAHMLPTKVAVLVAAHDHLKWYQDLATALMYENWRLATALQVRTRF